MEIMNSLPQGRHPGPPWLSLIFGLVLAAAGCFLAFDVKELPRRHFEKISRRSVEAPVSFTRSFSYQRFLGSIMGCVGVGVVIYSAVRMVV
jgi:hypothetical protein